MTPGPITDATASMVSAFFAVGANNPADVVRTRLYNQPFEIVNGKRVGQWYSGVLDCAGHILKDEGILAFWKGFTGHFMRTGPHYVVSFMFIGFFQRKARELKEKQDKMGWEAE